jgi:hypothetical protein
MNKVAITNFVLIVDGNIPDVLTAESFCLPGYSNHGM